MTPTATTLLSTTTQSPIFQATWPSSLKPKTLTTTQKVARFAWNLFSSIVFPIGIIRLLNKALFHITGAFIHPASRISNTYNVDEREIYKDHIVTFQTPDGQILEGYLHVGSSSPANRRAIIYALGRNAYVDNVADEVIAFSKTYASNADVLILNYRGVGKSTGLTSPEGLALDVYSAGEYLHKVEGIDPSRIIYWGHSLGGYAATKGGALFQEAHPEARVSIVNDRSFCTLSKTTSKIVGSVPAKLVKWLGWELDATKAWQEFKGRKVVIFNKRDDFIPYETSFRESLGASPSDTQVIELQPKYSAHTLPLRYQEESAKALGSEMIRAWNT